MKTQRQPSVLWLQSQFTNCWTKEECMAKLTENFCFILSSHYTQRNGLESVWETKKLLYWKLKANSHLSFLFLCFHCPEVVEIGWAYCFYFSVDFEYGKIHEIPRLFLINMSIFQDNHKLYWKKSNFPKYCNYRKKEKGTFK